MGWEWGGWCCQPHASAVPSTDPVLRAMWPDGEQSITEVTKRPLTAGTLFKNSMVALVENLASKVGDQEQLGTSLHQCRISPWQVDMSPAHLGVSLWQLGMASRHLLSQPSLSPRQLSVSPSQPRCPCASLMCPQTAKKSLSWPSISPS